MFGLGLGETLLLAIIALVAIGPKQLPEVARTIGRFLNELRRASGELGRAMREPEKRLNNHFPTDPPIASPPVNPPPASPVAASPSTPPAVALPPTEEKKDA